MVASSGRGEILKTSKQHQRDDNLWVQMQPSSSSSLLLRRRLSAVRCRLRLQHRCASVPFSSPRGFRFSPRVPPREGSNIWWVSDDHCMVKKVCCELTRTCRRVSDLSELDAPLYEETNFYRRHALMIGEVANACNYKPPPPRIRPPHHAALARDRGIVKPTPRRGADILGAAAPGLSGCRLVGARLAHDYDGAAPHGLCEPPSGTSSPQSDSGDSSPQSGSGGSSPRAPLDFGLDIGAQINVFMIDMRTTASTTASLDLLAPLAGLSCGQTTADLAEHLEQLVCH